MQSTNNSIRAKIQELASLLRLEPLANEMASDRSRERHRHIAWTSLTAAVAKILTAITMLITVPLTLNYLGAERFGMWATIIAVITMAGFADLGLSNGVMNAIAHASGRDERDDMSRTVSSGLLILSVICVAILLVFAAIYPNVDWASLFNVSSTLAANEAGPTVAVLIACFALTLPLGMVQKVQMGLQKGYLSNSWEAVASVASLVSMLIAIRMEVGLHWLALAIAAAPVVTRGLNTVVFFGSQQKWLRPNFKAIGTDRIKHLLRTSALFFVLQLAVVVGFQSDNIIIARILGSEAVAEYAVAIKIFMLPAMFVGFVVTAQWPAFGEALTRGDISWIKETFFTTLRANFLVTVPIAIALVIWGKAIIKVWSGDDVVPSTELLVGMGIWSLLLVVGSTVSALLNGLHVVKFQAITAILMASTNIMLSIYLVGRIGVPGAIYGTLISYSIFVILPCWYYVPRYLRRLSESRTGFPQDNQST